MHLYQNGMWLKILLAIGWNGLQFVTRGTSREDVFVIFGLKGFTVILLVIRGTYLKIACNLKKISLRCEDGWYLQVWDTNNTYIWTYGL